MSGACLTALCLSALDRTTIVVARTKEGERLRPLLISSAILMAAAAGSAQANGQSFQSPSGNILCVVSEDGLFGVRCDLEVDRQTYTDRPATCEGMWGTSFVVLRAGSGLLNCALDEIPIPETPAVLPYGVTLELDGITCLSETTGMTCTNAEGGGFAVRRAEQRIF